MAHIQKSTKIAFPLFITARCPKCNMKLASAALGNLQHDLGNGCPFEGKVFKGPVVYLEEVK
jgi:hypothetical protein